MDPLDFHILLSFQNLFFLRRKIEEKKPYVPDRITCDRSFLEGFILLGNNRYVPRVVPPTAKPIPFVLPRERESIHKARKFSFVQLACDCYQYQDIQNLDEIVVTIPRISIHYPTTINYPEDLFFVQDWESPTRWTLRKLLGAITSTALEGTRENARQRPEHFSRPSDICGAMNEDALASGLDKKKNIESDITIDGSNVYADVSLG
jgi:hypothetical protein